MKMHEIDVQTEAPTRWEGTDIGTNDGNFLLSLSRMENFIRLSTAHAANCGKQLVHIKRDTLYGAMIQHVWKCPCCLTELSMHICSMIKSSDITQVRALSCEKPGFNLRMAKGIQLTGINTTKLIKFMHGEMGIKISHANNLQNQITKVRKSIHSTYADRLAENRKEHVNAVCQSAGYCGNVHWESNGVI